VELSLSLTVDVKVSPPSPLPLHSCQFEHDRSAAQIDTKVTMMVSWMGLIITLILAVGNVLFNATDFLKILDVSSVLYILGASVASMLQAKDGSDSKDQNG
jgi:hypothetical protein